METDFSPQAARILDCAQDLIAGGGYNGFSYADISAQVGITKASIHHHFPKKSDLVRVLMQRYRAAAAAGMAALDANVADPSARLQAYAAWWANCINDASMPICIGAMLAAETPALPPEVAAEVQQHFDQLVNWLERVLAAGAATRSFRLQASPADEAQVFMATVHGAMLSARACGQPPLFQRIVGASLAQLAAPG